MTHDAQCLCNGLSRLQLALIGDSSDVDALKKDVDDMNRMLEGYLAFARGDSGEETVETDIDVLLREIGNEARIESIEFASGGSIAGVHVATQYRANGYLAVTPKLHVRVSFDRPVAGPLSIGRGWHVGFGVLWPVGE